jgi:hypothetical protein
MQKPIYHFDRLTDTGINDVPVNALVQIKDDRKMEINL